jgi:uncharacterized protein YcfJ
MSEKIVGVFSTAEEAARAKATLEQEGLSPQQRVVDRQAVSNQLPIEDTQAIEGAKGGAVMGAVVGGSGGLMMGLLANAVAEPGVTAVPQSSLLMMTVLGALIGAIAIGIVASITGSRVGNTQKTQTAPEEVHVVVIDGSEEQFVQASRIVESAKGLAIK